MTLCLVAMASVLAGTDDATVPGRDRFVIHEPNYVALGTQGGESLSELQISFMYLPLPGPRHFDVAMGLSLRSFWQFYDGSSPVREHNYSPELTFKYRPEPARRFRWVSFGYQHESNGEDGGRSRTWDRIYGGAMWQWVAGGGRHRFRLGGRLWAIVFKKDNPQIDAYQGFGELRAAWLWKSEALGSGGLHLAGRKGGLTRFNRGRVTIWAWWRPPYAPGFRYLPVLFSQSHVGHGQSLNRFDQFETFSRVGLGWMPEDW